jgi:hypothetical protein
VLELFMAADLSHLVPTIPFQLPDDFPAIHRPLLISISAKYALLHTFSNMELLTLMPKSRSEGGTLEAAQHMANHESPRTTKLYDRKADETSLDEVEKISI